LWNRRTRSIRRSLALRLVAIGGILLTLLFYALDLLIEQELYGRFDIALVERGRLLATEITGAVPSGPRLTAAWPEFRAGGHTDFFQIWDRRGQTLGRSPTSGERDLIPPSIEIGDEPVLYDMPLPDGHRGRAAALRLAAADDAAPALFVIATERDALDALERRIHVALLVTIGIVLLLVVTLSLAELHIGLRPLAEFGDAAVRRAHDPEAAGPDPAALPIELQPIAAALDGAFSELTQMLLRERRFARDLAHELRTPLAEMYCLLESMTPRDVENQDSLAQIRQTLTGMTRIVDGLLALARYEAKVDAPVVEPVDLATIVRTQCRAIEPRATQRGIRLEVSGSAEVWAMADELLMERIMSNLLGNAIDYSPGNEIVNVSCQLHGEVIELSITNAAPELRATDVNRLGERHFRASATGTGSAHSGLGLALCMALANQLGLRIIFELNSGHLTASLAGLRSLETETAI